MGPVHHLIADACAAQHPGRPEARTIQSVAVHLVGLHLALERGVTVRDVHATGDDPDAHGLVVRAWTEGVWQDWAPHHAQIRAWAVTQ